MLSQLAVLDILGQADALCLVTSETGGLAGRAIAVRLQRNNIFFSAGLPRISGGRLIVFCDWAAADRR